MTTGKSEPGQSGKGAQTAGARQRRLAEALRENLKKRKAQARSRATAETPPKPSAKPE